MSAKFDAKDDLDYDLLYNYIYEKYREDVNLLDVKKDILTREDYYLQKTILGEIEYQLLLIRKKNG